MSAQNPRVLVVLCEHGALLASGLEGLPHVTVRVVPGACRDLGELSELLTSGADRGVVALCGAAGLPEELRVELQAAGKDAGGFLGLDPWADGGDAARARLLVRGAAERVRAYPGAQPANLAPYFPERLHRRALLRFPPLAYRVVPRVDRDRCAAEDGCRLCEGACPEGAIQVRDGRVILDRSRCVTCGACVAACPREAVVRPGCTGAEVAAHVWALLDGEADGPRPRGIVYVCAGTRPQAGWHPAWLPVPVTCVETLPPHWMLAPLLLGAAAVTVAPCTCGRARRSPTGQDRLEFCREYLRAVGLPEGRVALTPSAPPGANSAGRRDQARFGSVGLDATALFSTRPEAASRVFLALAEAAGAAKARVEHPAAPLGRVTVDESACTGCGMCARVCPTSALTFAEGQEVVLTWDPGPCVGCGQCTFTCPEVERGAIRVHKGVDAGELRQGRRVVYRNRVARCVACGAPIAPQGMLARVMGLLAEVDPALQRVLTQYCSDCRSVRPPV